MDGGGCIAWLLIIVTGVALVVYEGKRAVTALAPYWPVLELAGGVALGSGAALAVLWLVGLWLWEITEPYRQRRRTIRQIAEAQAEIRAIHSWAARQMQRAARRRRRG